MSGDCFDALFEKPAARAVEVGRAVAFDIETGPEPELRLREFFQLDLDKVKDRHLIGTEFDPGAVKLGNLKDKAKIAAKIEAKAQEFVEAREAAIIAFQTAESDQWAAFLERAPLSPITGRVLAIGYSSPEGSRLVDDARGEELLLSDFWEQFESLAASDGKLVGFNVKAFDLPFLVRRSWLLDIEVPAELLRDHRHWHRAIIDLMDVWGCGAYQDRISLDRLAQYLGTTRKPEGTNGADFHRLYNGSFDEKTRAYQYLRNDIAMTVEIAKRLGVM